jgi:hypothetical protein
MTKYFSIDSFITLQVLSQEENVAFTRTLTLEAFLKPVILMHSRNLNSRSIPETRNTHSLKIHANLNTRSILETSNTHALKTYANNNTRRVPENRNTHALTKLQSARAVAKLSLKLNERDRGLERNDVRHDSFLLKTTINLYERDRGLERNDVRHDSFLLAVITYERS